MSADETASFPVLEAVHLSPRELQVLAAVAAGERTREIAARLGLSENTVKSNLFHIYKRTGSRNRVEAARYYVNHYATARAGSAPAAQPTTRTMRPSRR